MKGEEIINVCQAVTHGNARYVRNIKNNRKGLVTAAEGMDIHVQVESRNEVWRFDECEEMAADHR